MITTINMTDTDIYTVTHWGGDQKPDEDDGQQTNLELALAQETVMGMIAVAMTDCGADWPSVLNIEHDGETIDEEQYSEMHLGDFNPSNPSDVIAAKIAQDNARKSDMYPYVVLLQVMGGCYGYQYQTPDFLDGITQACDLLGYDTPNIVRKLYHNGQDITATVAN